MRRLQAHLRGEPVRPRRRAQAAAEHSNIDLLKGQGGYKEDITAQTKRDEPSSDLSQKELDARTEPLPYRKALELSTLLGVVEIGRAHV